MMATGQRYTAKLNQDNNGIPTPSEYDAAQDSFVQKVKLTDSYATPGSTFPATGVPVVGADDSNVARAIKTDSAGRLQLAGTISAAGEFSLSSKEAAARAVDAILDTIGVENIKAFLPMWETSGTVAYDLLNRDFQFEINGPTLAQSGPFGVAMAFDGVNDYLRQKPVTEATAGGTDYPLNGPTLKAAQKMVAIATSVGFVRLRLKVVGSLPSATVRVSIYTDNAGVPGSLVTNGQTAELACSTLTASYGAYGLYFPTAPNLQKNQQYWVVLEYGVTTGVDAANYVVWEYDATGTYGQPRATFDGTAWTAVAGQSHAFGLWNNALVLDGDYTVVVLAKNNTVNPAYKHMLSAAANSYQYEAFHIRMVNEGYVQAAVVESGIVRTAAVYTWPAEFRVYGLTFSKANSTDKLKLYLDGQLRASGSGTANAAADRWTQPVVIACSTRRDGSISNYWGGLIGPVIITANTLTDAQIAKVSHYLLAARKRQAAV